MSGPKDYSPPPRYSIDVFNGKLNQAFQLQSRLKMLRSEIECLHVSDHQLSIHFDCSHELATLQKNIEKALRTLVFDYKGTFGQEEYNRVQSEIDAKISTIQKQINACESIKVQFTAKKGDYESYCSYLLFHDNSKISFEDFKSQIIFYLKNNLESRLPEIFDEAKEKIGRVELRKQPVAFTFGFNSKAESQRQIIIDHVAQKEGDVNQIRAEISDRVLDKLKTTNVIIPQSRPLASDATTLTEKIMLLIRRTDDPVARKAYSASLRRLEESESLRDLYFFKELHDSILDTEKSRKRKIEVSRMLSKLNEARFHNAVDAEKQNLIKLCLVLLSLSGITSSEVESLRLKLDVLVKSSAEAFEEDEIRQREHLFLKAQIVLCLENLGYEVMNDLEVIDFEKENDFLIKIHDQNNYLNLKFKNDGSMRYVFQIPEDRKDLSTDQRDLKLHEMKVTCDEFKSVLHDLSGMGLKIDLKTEKPIEYDSLVSVPTTRRERLTKSSRKKEKQQSQKKYRTIGAD
jgi:hypothetical protein